MATRIENAAKGQRSAMTTLYEDNKQKVYFVARCLLTDKSQAENATVTVFKECWSNLGAAAIGTEGQFTNYVVCRVLDYCKSRLLKKNPKALRVPVNKNFLVPNNLTVSDTANSELDYILENMPHIQKYIFVLHTAGTMEIMQIARVLKLDSKTVRIAVETEAENVKRILALYGKRCTCSYEDILRNMKQAEADASVPGAVDEQMAAIIDAIATPVEERERRHKHRVSVLSVLFGSCVVIALLIFGLTSDTTGADTDEDSSQAATQTSETAAGTQVSTEAEETEATETVETASGPVDEDVIYYADIEIADYGTVTVQLDQAAAPVTVENFVKLAQSGFYDGLTFHRIIEGFMMQGGDPEGNGTGGSEETIVGEFTDNGYDNALTHTRGAISMARSSDYDSASSQFFIVHEDSEFLDGQYAAFGYVTEGMDIVDAICEAAEPTDSNGTISSEAQPVIVSVTIRTEAVQ